MKNWKVLVLMGSDSDMSTMLHSKDFFDYFGIEVEYKVSSAHRNPVQTAELAAKARDAGYSALVCGAGMAAHLAGVCAAHTDLPVIGVPLAGGMMDGLDALLSTVQMPRGIPVATVAVGKSGAVNAAILCARMFSVTDKTISDKLIQFAKNGSKIPTKQ